MPNALMLLVNALMPNALMLLDEQRKNAANRNLIAMPCSQNAFPILFAQQAVRNLARARLIRKGCTCGASFAKLGTRKNPLRFG